jgi:hypothetical protein
MKKILRPFGLMGCLVLGAVVYHFFGDKIKAQIPGSLGGTKA